MKNSFETKFVASGVADARIATFLMRGAGLMYGATLYSLLARLLTTFLVAKALGPSALGIFALCFASVQILTTLAIFGQDFGLIRFVSLALKQNDLSRVRALLLVSMGLGAALAIPAMLGLVLGLPYFLPPEEAVAANQAIPLFAFALLPQVWTGLLAAFGLARGKRLAKALPDRIVGVTVQLAVSFAAIQFGWGLWGVSLAFLLNALASLMVVVWLVHPLYPRRVRHIPLLPVGRELVAFSWKLGLSNALGYLLLNAALFILGVTNAAQAGIYAAASRLTLPGLLFLEAIGSVFGPHAAGRLGDASLEHDLQRVTNWMIVASAPIFILLFAFAKTWMGLLGPEFAASANVLAVMALAQMINILTSACNTVISLSHRPDLKIFNTVFAWGANLFFVLALTPQWGALGAASAYLFAVVIIDVLEYGETRFVLGIRPWGALLVRPALIILTMALVLSVFGYNTVLELWQVAVVSLLFVGVYGLLMWRFGLPTGDVDALRLLAQRMYFWRAPKAV